MTWTLSSKQHKFTGKIAKISTMMMKGIILFLWPKNKVNISIPCLGLSSAMYVVLLKRHYYQYGQHFDPLTSD